MRSQYFRRTLLATVVVVSLLVPGTVMSTQPANAAEEVPPWPAGCADMTGPEENHASIRLRVDEPASEAQVPVDEHGKIAIGGILHKQAAMVDVSDEKVTSSEFTLGPRRRTRQPGRHRGPRVCGLHTSGRTRCAPAPSANPNDPRGFCALSRWSI
ncbi:hypothetical protein ACW0JT_25080 [Arthrobacter sp. SA17]